MPSMTMETAGTKMLSTLLVSTGHRSGQRAAGLVSEARCPTFPSSGIAAPYILSDGNNAWKEMLSTLLISIDHHSKQPAADLILKARCPAFLFSDIAAPYTLFYSNISEKIYSV